MSQAGRLPDPETMQVYTIRVVPAPTATFADIQLVTGTGYLVFTIGNVPRLTAPIFAFPAGTATITYPDAGSTGTGISASFGSPDRTSIKRFKIPYEIGIGQNFDITLYWPTAPSGLSASTYFWILMEGPKTRGIS